MWQIPLNMSTANLPLLTQISLGICSADDRHSPEKLEHKCAENAQPMLEKYRPQLCQGWQNQQQQLQPLWCQTYCTQHPFVQCFQTSCQNPPEATALCQKWQGSRLSLKLVLWTPKAQLAARTSGAGRSECRACFSAPTNILQAALSWEAVLARFVFLESSQAALLAQHIHRYGSPRPLEDREVLAASNLCWPLLSTNKSQWHCAQEKEAVIMQRLWHWQIFTDTDEFLKLGFSLKYMGFTSTHQLNFSQTLAEFSR